MLPLLFASVTPSLVAFVLAGIEGGTAGVGQLLAQAGRWRFGIGWYAVAILLAPLIWVVSLGMALLLGGRGPEVRLDFLVPVAAIGEEFGWRGYALPRLQDRMGALPASLLIGVIWAAWHLPYFIVGMVAMAIVRVAAATGAVAASGGPLIGLSRSRPVGAAAEPGLP